MTIEEIKTACESAIQRQQDRLRNGLAELGPAVVQLVLPGLARGNHRRLAGRYGPLGEVLCDHEIDGRECSVVNFKAQDVLKWIDKVRS